MPNTPIILTIASSKGGVGKSTICVCLAGALAHAGRRVHIIDLDKNATIKRWADQHKPDIAGLSVSAIEPEGFSNHFKAIAETACDVILIDVAGLYEKALVHAMVRSHLVIIPAQPSEPDIHEAQRIVRDLTDLNDSFHGQVPYRLLLNLFDPLDPHYQRHTVDEVARLGLQRFDTVLYRRAPYREAFLNGQPPHYALASRETVRKAAQEVDALLAEVWSIVAPETRQEAAA